VTVNLHEVAMHKKDKRTCRLCKGNDNHHTDIRTVEQRRIRSGVKMSEIVLTLYLIGHKMLYPTERWGSKCKMWSCV